MSPKQVQQALRAIEERATKDQFRLTHRIEVVAVPKERKYRFNSKKIKSHKPPKAVRMARSLNWELDRQFERSLQRDT